MNSPDLDGADILWARELTAEENAMLVAAFPERRLWHLDLAVREDKDFVRLRRAKHDGDVVFEDSSFSAP